MVGWLVLVFDGFWWLFVGGVGCVCCFRFAVGFVV